MKQRMFECLNAHAVYKRFYARDIGEVLINGPSCQKSQKLWVQKLQKPPSLFLHSPRLIYYNELLSVRNYSV